MELQPYRAPGGTAVALPNSDRTRQLVAAWLLAQTADNTRTAYQRDIEAWLEWLTQREVPALSAVRAHADAWARQMERTPGRGGKLPSAPTVNRRLASVSSFYDYCVSVDALDVNRVKAVKRHPIDKQFSPTFRPTAEQTKTIISVARDDGPRSYALVILMIFSGARVSEVLAAEWADLDFDGQQRVLKVIRKGGRPAYLPLKPVALVGGAIDTYREHRAHRAHVTPADLAGPIFVDRYQRPLTRQSAANLVAGIGRRAGCPRLSPHSLRHAFASLATEAKVSKDDLQKWMGHRDSRTTENYIRRVGEYASHPGQKIADLLKLTPGGADAA